MTYDLQKATPRTIAAIADDLATYVETLADAEHMLTTDLSPLDRIETARAVIDMKERLDSLGKELIGKGEAIAHVIARLGSDITIVKAEKKRLATREHVLETGKKWLEQYTIRVLDQYGIPQLRTPTVTIKPRGNGGVYPLTVDESKLDRFWFDVTLKVSDSVWQIIEAAEFNDLMVYERAPATQRIREALDRGETIDGAKFEERGKHLRIT